jgi:hypothetical protein
MPEYLEQDTSTLGVTLRVAPGQRLLIHKVLLLLLVAMNFPRKKVCCYIETATLYGYDSSHASPRESTRAYKAPTEHAQGTVEAIWSSGEEGAKMATWRPSLDVIPRRQVYFKKFTRNQELSNSEVQCRVDMGVTEAANHVVPLVEHLQAGGNSKGSTIHTMDVNDERFKPSICLEADQSSLLSIPMRLSSHTA